ncbi:CHASE domain-containing protein [Roseateles sp.]|uniref:CHASE domain-containing protein n=1 Tax=Roseateles sp. TaxID=1971397 RepID=UPI003BA55025
MILSAVALVGLVLSAFAFKALRDAEMRRQDEAFAASTETVLNSLELELIRAAEATRNGALMLEQLPQLQRADFSRYAQSLVGKVPAIRVLEWQPWVKGSERVQFELDARAQGLKDYRVVEPDEAEGTWRAAPPRDQYLPILFAWPEQGAALGFDLAADTVRMASKRQAGVLGEPVASESFRVLRGDIPSSTSFGLAITAPVYAVAPPNSPAPVLRGFLAAVIELPPILQQAAERANAAHLDLLVFDKDMSLSKPIYVSIGANSDLQARVGEDVHDTHTSDRVRSLSVSHREWHVVLHPRPTFFAAQPPSLATWVGGAGLLCTLLLMLAAHRTLQDRSRVLNARHQLLDERQRLQNIIDGTGAGSWEYNFETEEFRVNEHWAEITGVDRALYDGKRSYRWREDCHADDLNPVEEALLKHLRAELPAFVVEYRRHHADGRWIWVAVRGKVLQRDTQGRALIIAGTMLEIEARKQAEARILELNATLEQRVAERSAELEEAMHKLSLSREELTRSEARATLNTLAAGVSHELSTPMSNSLISASTLAALAREFQQSMQAGGLRRSELNQFLVQMIEGSELAVRNLERAAELIKSFRQVATDQASEQRRTFDLRQVVEELLDALAPSLRRQGHQIRLEIPEGMALDSYPGPLDQVLTNLINNAYLHAFDGLAQGGELRISASWAGDAHVQINCQDNGRGMDEATQAKLFTPFFSTKMGKGGSGLGMSIVDNLVNKTLGGHLRVESAPGQGTLVSIILPVSAPLPKPQP